MTPTRHLTAKLLLTLLLCAALLLLYLDARITGTFAGRMWELPARVYARPLELYTGAPLQQAELTAELDLLGYRRVSQPRRPGAYSAREGVITVYLRGFAFPQEPEPARRIELAFSGQGVQSLAAAGAGVDLLRLDPLLLGSIYPSHGEDRLLVRLRDVPPVLVEGLLAVEDRGFRRHPGISVTGIARAALDNLRSGRVVAGGSTITQQLVKNYYLTPRRSIPRKLTEMAMAVLLELHYSKEQILESYLNEVYLGQDGARAIHGFALAARHYFSRPLSQLGLHQQALLIGMIQGASLYHPQRNPQRALQRRNLVLEVMAGEGVIGAEHAMVAKAMPLDLQPAATSGTGTPAFLDLVHRQLRRDYRQEDLTRLGLQIFTTLDPLIQRELEQSSTQVMSRLDAAGGLQTATVATRPDSGEVVALVGGRDAGYPGFNRALDARRPAGSLLKPAVYLAALEQPRRYTLASVLRDEPVRIRGPDGIWSPRNFDRSFHGEVLLHRALAQSYNAATVRLGMQLGLESVIDTLRRLGLEGEVPAVPALFLGAGGYSPLRIAAVYQTIAAGGFRMPLRSIRSVVDAEGIQLQRYPLEYDRTVSLQGMHLLHYAMREVVNEGTGRGVYRHLDPAFAVAGKTGTTDDGRDSWFAGFSGDLLAVTWVGHDDNRATGFTGSSGALRIWGDFMARAARRPLHYRMPDGMVTSWIDAASGVATGRGCPGARLLPFIEGSVPDAHTGCRSRNGGIKGWFERLFERE